MKPDKEAVVTGSTGFVGSHLVKRLVDNGWSVHVIVRPESNIEILKQFGSNVTIFRHNGTMEGMMSLFERVTPSVVFHLASCFIVEHKAKDIQALVDSNILFGLQLVEAMTASHVQRLVNAGTSWQHFNNEAYNPVNLYASSKEAFEALLRYYIEAKGLKTITLKLFDTYGPDDPRPKLFALLRGAVTSQQAIAMSPGEQLIDLVYIADVVDAFMIAADRLSRNECDNYEEYAVSSGKPLALRELVDIYQKVTGKKLMIKWGGRSYRVREVMVPWNGGQWIEGWSPKVSIEKGIELIETNTPGNV